MPKYAAIPSQEVLYFREKQFHPEKVKIMMTKSVQQRDQHQFGMDLGIPNREQPSKWERPTFLSQAKRNQHAGSHMSQYSQDAAEAATSGK